MESIRSCSRCSVQGTLEVDPLDGFLICTACGLVADEGIAWLQHDQPEGGMEAFANVDTSGRVKGRPMYSKLMHAMGATGLQPHKQRRCPLGPR